MANPLFNQLRNNPSSQSANMPFQNMNMFLQRLNEYKNSFRGDPNQVLNNLIQSGKISQEQLNSAMNTAKQIRQFLR